MSIYKACDIRGLAGSELDAGAAVRIGWAIGQRLGGGPVLVSGDARLSTPQLRAALIRGLAAAGCGITDIGVQPTPVFYFARQHLGLSAGVQTTASHNPAPYNGFKLTLGHWPVTEEDMAEVAALAESPEARRAAEGLQGGGPGAWISGGAPPAGAEPPVTRVEVRQAYEENILKALEERRQAFGDDRLAGRGRKASAKVVVDAGNGVCGPIAPGLFRRLGFEVVELFCEPDGNFPGREPNPAVAANLKELCARVVAEGADLGVAYDGDGDRVAFVDGKGRVLPNDHGIVLMARLALGGAAALGGTAAAGRGAAAPAPASGGAPAALSAAGAGAQAGRRVLVYDQKCSLVVSEEVTRLGGEPVMEKSGHAFIKRTFMERDAALGGEISGHYFFRELMGDDGMYGSLRLASGLRDAGLSLADLAEAMPVYPITPDLRLRIDGPAQEYVNRVHRAASEKGYPVLTLDGVRVELPDAWGLIRPSVTEPMVTLRFEGKTEEAMRRAQDVFFQAVPELKGKAEKYLQGQQAEEVSR